MAKRVLIFSLAYYPVEGGAEIAVKEITNRISDIEFDLITLSFDETHPAQEKVGSVNVYRVDSSKTLFPFAAYKLAKRLHQERPYDAIWAIMANWAGLAALFFKHSCPGVAYILTLQEGDSLEYIERKTWFIYPLFKRIFTKADKVQAISTYLAKWAKSMGYQGAVEVIPNGVPTEKFINYNPRPFGTTLITTSRLVKKNAIGDIIDALSFLPQEFSLKILGIGPLEKELKEKVRRQDLSGRVRFLGHVPYEEIPKHLHAADIFIRPSLSEGMGNSFIEGMAAGLPVIATPVGGIPDFLKDGETGLFCKVNDPEDIAQQVKKLSEDPVLIERIRENALKMVQEKYDWDLVAREMKNQVFDKV
jgi:glycosyltransferase involved in cell wall biosynthesis